MWLFCLASCALSLPPEGTDSDSDDVVPPAPAPTTPSTPGMTTPVEPELLTSAASMEFVGEEAGDEAGFSVAIGPDLNGDGMVDVVIGAPGHASDAGVVYGVFGPVASVPDLGTAPLRLDGLGSGARAGHSVAWGDLNGDEQDDLVVGAPGTNTVYVVYGPLGGVVDLSLADVILTGPDGSSAGETLAVVDDLTGDTTADLVVGAPDSSGGRGATYVVPGGLTSGTLEDQAHRWDGVARSAWAIFDAGDFTGDGQGDLWIMGSSGAPTFDTAYLLDGPVTGSGRLADVPTQVAGGDYFGLGTGAGAVDLTGDSMPDLAIPVTSVDEDTVHVVAGGTTGAQLVLEVGDPIACSCFPWASSEVMLPLPSATSAPTVPRSCWSGTRSAPPAGPAVPSSSPRMPCHSLAH